MDLWSAIADQHLRVLVGSEVNRKRKGQNYVMQCFESAQLNFEVLHVVHLGRSM